MANARLTRREVIVSTGKVIAGAALFGTHSAAQSIPSPTSNVKQLSLPPIDSLDPAAHSHAENLFWTDIMREHTAFLALLMPGPDLAAQRARAEALQHSFSTQLDRIRSTTTDRSNFAALNQATVESIKPLIELKQSILDSQNAGKVHTLIWPTFLEHAIHEAQRGSARLARLASGDVTLTYIEVLEFWTEMMSDHAALLAHLLDPKEADLIATALDTSAQFKGYRNNVQSKGLRGVQVLTAAEELIDFETATQTGVNLGTIRSIIPPMLADHVRREALKFVDELKRTAYRT